MPDWLLPLLAAFAIVAFVGFAFRQGSKVTPDRSNSDKWDQFGGPPDHYTGSDT